MLGSGWPELMRLAITSVTASFGVDAAKAGANDAKTSEDVAVETGDAVVVPCNSPKACCNAAGDNGVPEAVVALPPDAKVEPMPVKEVITLVNGLLDPNIPNMLILNLPCLLAFALL